jgi:hypothetical protein
MAAIIAPELEVESVEYSIQPPTLVEQEPANSEIPIELPVIEPESAPEIDESSVLLVAI